MKVLKILQLTKKENGGQLAAYHQIKRVVDHQKHEKLVTRTACSIKSDLHYYLLLRNTNLRLIEVDRQTEIESLAKSNESFKKLQGDNGLAEYMLPPFGDNRWNPIIFLARVLFAEILQRNEKLNTRINSLIKTSNRADWDKIGKYSSLLGGILI